MKKYGYNDYFTSDTSPTRWDVKGTFEANSRLTTKIWNLLENIDGKSFADLITKGPYLKTWRIIEENIFSLK